jgi:rSAM/selenodomain-associated transferase 1
MTKYPEPGQTKTRLIPALGVGGAAKLHRRLGIHTVKTVGSFNPEIHYSGGDPNLMHNWLGDFKYVTQSKGDLGDRMKQAFQLGFDQGCDRIVMIGTDCPAIDKALIDRAFLALNKIEVVFGPAIDGGYYLIGLRKQILELFSTIEWSTASVLQDSLTIVKDLDLSYELLEILPDIDRPEDLQYLKADIGVTE